MRLKTKPRASKGRKAKEMTSRIVFARCFQSKNHCIKQSGRVLQLLGSYSDHPQQTGFIDIVKSFYSRNSVRERVDGDGWQAPLLVLVVDARLNKKAGFAARRAGEEGAMKMLNCKVLFSGNIGGAA